MHQVLNVKDVFFKLKFSDIDRGIYKHAKQKK